MEALEINRMFDRMVYLYGLPVEVVVAVLLGNGYINQAQALELTVSGFIDYRNKKASAMGG